MKNKAAMTTIGALAMAAATGAAVPAQAAIIYPINITSTTPEVGGELTPLSDTIIGSITTDGTLGVLQPSNIVGWNFELRDNIRPAFDVTLTPANSGIYVFTGTGLSATPTMLSFDFSDAGSVFVIQGLLHGFSSGYQYFCLQATSGPCIAGETIVPDYYATDGVLASGLTGPTPLSVPEPASWAMMLTGFGVAGLSLRKRARIGVAYS